MKQKALPKYPSEMRKRAMRMVLDHQQQSDSECAAISAIAAKVGSAPETLHQWVRQAQADLGALTTPSAAVLAKPADAGSTKAARGRNHPRRVLFVNLNKSG
ncbi:hypothetical protein ACQUJS_03135 [Ralstonia pseudosolanacearum]|uniref:Transposase n=1 Tax=Ralstonia solanacearum TaxID=305 RepID=A0A0S4TX91_RALSL|nr:protein of unknown function [Ralstonia solanacearum]